MLAASQKLRTVASGNWDKNKSKSKEGEIPQLYIFS
jgi:hypothetical protein